MNKKKITINFCDFWPGLNKEDNYFTNCLKKFYDVELSDKPQYLIYSVFGNEYLNYDCIRIFFTGENFRPDFNVCDYAIGFDYLQLEDRYLRFPLYYMNVDDYKLSLKKHLEIPKGSRKFCNFIYSNGDAHPNRASFYKALSSYKHIDSGGRYLNNIGETVKDKLGFQREYKFSIAFENTTTPGYTTEKIIQAFAAQTIPIYWGDPKIASEFNPKAFINCHDFNSFNEVLEEIKRIDDDDNLLYEMLEQPIYIEERIFEPMDILGDFLQYICNQSIEDAYRSEYYGLKNPPFHI